jgi:hypothetical protein
MNIVFCSLDLYSVTSCGQGIRKLYCRIALLSYLSLGGELSIKRPCDSREVFPARTHNAEL